MPLARAAQVVAEVLADRSRPRLATRCGTRGQDGRRRPARCGGHRRSGAAGPSAGRRDGAGLHPTGDRRHGGCGRAHAGHHAAVGGARAAPAARFQRAGHHGLRAARRHRRRAVRAAGAGGGLHRRRRPGHDAGRDRDGRPAVPAGHRDRFQRRRTQPDQAQAETGRARRRRSGQLPPGLFRGRRDRDGRRGRRGDHRAGPGHGGGGRPAPTRSHRDRCQRRSGRLSGCHGPQPGPGRPQNPCPVSAGRLECPVP